MEISLLRWLRENNDCHVYENYLYHSVIDEKSRLPQYLSCSGAFFFILVLNGTCSAANHDSCSRLRHADLMILSPGMEVILYLQPDTCVSCISFEPEFFDSLPVSQHVYQQLAGFINLQQIPIIRLAEPARDNISRTMTLLNNCSSYQLNKDGIMKSLCNSFLLQVAECLNGNNLASSNHTKRALAIYRNFRRLLVENYRTAHDIEFYADRLCISTTYLSRVVKKTTGRTVRFHIAYFLCAEAQRLLDSTDLDIKEVALMTGFSDQSVFGKFFKKHTGMTPSKFKTRKTTIPNP